MGIQGVIMAKNRHGWLLGGAAATVTILAGATSLLAATSGTSNIKQTAGRDQVTLGTNNWGLEVTNYGSFGFDVQASDAGGEFPRGSGHYILFAGGFQFGTLVNGTPQVSQVEFDSEFQPGSIVGGPAPVGELTSNDPIGTVLLATDSDPSLPAGWPSDLSIVGNSATYAVFNDLDPSLSSDNGQVPLGVEISQHSFAFAKQGAQGDIVYLRFTLTNKSDQEYTNSYAEVWFDPDNGSAGNDLTGCDVATSLGYVYNGDEEDRNTAMGADFFQGPIVEDPDGVVIQRGSVTFNKTDDYEFIEGDTEIPGLRVLGMSAFSFYINGTDPDTDTHRYNLMKGLTREGDVRANGPFDYSGDPVTGDGNNDGNPNDKRMALITGPFTLASGESQDVVVAIIGAEVTTSADPLDALTALRATDAEAQIAYNLDFIQQQPPPPPATQALAYDGEVLLTWDDSPESAPDIFGDRLGLPEPYEVLDTVLVNVVYDSLGNVVSYEEEIGSTIVGYEKYDFQGYRVYRSPSGDPGTWEMLAEFDKADGVTEVATKVFNNTLQKFEVHQLHIGTDSGLAYYFKDMGLQNGRPYYYSVTSYDYQADPTRERTLESPQGSNSIRVVPLEAPGGYDWSAASVQADSLIEHTGTSDGRVAVAVIDPSKVTGHTYRITFRDADIVTLEGDTVSTPVWDLTDEDTPGGETVVLAAQTNQSGDNAYKVVDGLLVQVMGPAPGWKTNVKGNPMIDEVIAVDASGATYAVEADGNGGPGADVWHSLNDGNAQLTYYLSAGGGEGTVGRFTRDGGDLGNLTAADIEMRWDYAPNNYGWWAFEDGSVGGTPFSLYRVDALTGTEEQLIPVLYSGGGTIGTYDLADSTADPYFGFGASDWTYAYTGDYAAFAADAADGVIDGDHGETELFARLIMGDFEQSGALIPNGTVIRFVTTKPNSSGDVYRFSTVAGQGFQADQAKADIKDIRVVPNPYYATSEYDESQFSRKVKFFGLPETCTIRIFTVSGDLVRTLKHKAGSNNDATDNGGGEPTFTSIESWDLQNEDGFWVASGVYVAHIEAPGIGTTFVKFAIIQGTEELGIF
jgi:hypothetical protein